MKKINKLDICVIVLVLSTSLPLIFNTYVTLTGTIQTIFKYILALCIYFLFKILNKKYNKLNTIISNILIIITIILIIVGIDGITTGILNNPLDKIGLGDFVNGDNRLISLFGYSNVLAAFIASALFFNIREYLKSRKVTIQALYKTTTLIFMIGIILTYCKGIFLILPILLIMYILMIRDKKQRIEIVENIVVSIIMAIMFVIAFEKICRLERYNLVWIELIIIVLINYVINIIMSKINIKTFSIKKVSVISVVIVILISTYIIIGLKQYDQYEVFNKKMQSNYDAKVIDNIQGNSQYVFEFDLKSQAIEEKSGFIINIKERDEKNREIYNTSISFGTYEGIKKIELTTQEATNEVKIEFFSNCKNNDRSLTIKKFSINNKEYPLKYKYLPTKLIEKVKNININYKTLKERIIVIKNALELSKQNLIVGIGGEGWAFKYEEVQDYNYTVKWIHSYPTKIILEFGILGIIVYIAIAIVLINIFIKLIKSPNINMLTTLFALIIIAMHSIIDMDMEYMWILLYVFGLLGMLNINIPKDTDITQKEKSVILPISLLTIVITICGYLIANPKIYSVYDKIADLSEEMNKLKVSSNEYKEINYKLTKEYEKAIKYERYNAIEWYNDTVLCYINSNCENKKEILENYYNKILQYKNVKKCKPEIIITKMIVVNNIVTELERQDSTQYDEITEKFTKIILDEYDETKEELKKALVEQNIYESNNIYQKELDYIYMNAQERQKSYLLGARIINETDIDIAEEDLENIKIETNKNILIYHTHGSESYKANEEYSTYEPYRSLDENYNVIKVGKYLAQLFEEKEFNVIHQIEYYDLPTTDGAYDRAKKDIEEILDQNNDISMVFDIHRDSISEIEYEPPTVEINGEKAAKLMFVMEINKEDENWMYNLKFALDIQKRANEMYPGLFKPMLIRETSYNQDLSKCAVLIEVGETYNTIEQALNSVKYLTDIF